ncbi:hypothetical protein QJS04_geneDACA006733 [Acorus gramineus]|uniref:O-fucosyltransferase family protein n=1 Tax=Acorus gramineus TaxID=55184 RepID=A0AAV9AU92_ACOGR|nr:hypothetical protein QJS04_geneDACA006733 [Acorus gramineus]
MLGRSGSLTRSGSFRAENLGADAITAIGNLCFALFVLGVLIFTVIAATYEPEDPLFRPTTKITNFLTSASNATFTTDTSVLRTGEDFLNSTTSAVAALPVIEIQDVTALPSVVTNPDETCDSNGPIDCTDPEVFHLMMRAAIEKFRDIHFYRFGKPIRGGDERSCDMAWRFRPKEGKTASLYKDYRRFTIGRSDGCNYTVVDIGEYHSGGNARKKKRNRNKEKPGFEPKNTTPMAVGSVAIPVVGEAVNDSLPVVQSESSFRDGKYLIYMGGGDRCKSMNHYLWSFLCALGEAQYLNRTLVMDLSICLSSMYTSTNQDEEGKDFRFYFDFEHLKTSASVLDQKQFWVDWGKWQKRDKLGLHLVEDFRVTPMKLRDVKDSLIMRKFGTVEPDNYWYRVCEGETESVIQRPWNLIWKSRRLMEIVSTIASRLNWDFDSVHVVRGEKARNPRLWPNLAADTSPDSLLSTLRDKVDEGRNLYIATNEADVAFFDPLKDKYSVHFLRDYGDLWDESSEWYSETKALNNGNPVEFDGYMRVEVDTEVFLRGKKQLETFNDLTSDCKDGVGTCGGGGGGGASS